jgi:uncharacterized protein with FMN-binding domain
MSTQETRQRFRLARKARNWGLSALLVASVGGTALYERASASANALQPLQLDATTATAEATADATDTLTGLYRDGEYTGIPVRAGRWGSTQVTAVIMSGKLTNFRINDYPHSTSRSLRISQVAIPNLAREAIQTQSAPVDIISGATLTTEAFIQSLQSALDQAVTAVTPTPALAPSGSSL